jgi:hypothetical protein
VGEADVYAWDDSGVDPVIERVVGVVGGERIFFTLYGPKDKLYDVEFRAELERGEIDDRDVVTKMGDLVRATLSVLTAVPCEARIEDNKIVNVRGGSHVAVNRAMPAGWQGKRATFMLVATESKCPPSN